MEYERIHKVQTGIISPSKLRLKLIGGPHHNRKKDGSNNNSSRTSPSKVEDVEFAKNSLLASNNGGDFVEEGNLKDSKGASTLHVAAPNLEASSENGVSNSCQSYENCDTLPKELGNMGFVKIQHFSKNGGGNSSTVHPMKASEEDNPDYDSNASSSSFEFHKGERHLHNPMVRHFSRPVPSKWNDAEKWIANRQHTHSHLSKKPISQSQMNRQPITTNLQRTAPEPTSSEQKALGVPVVDTKRMSSFHPTSQTGVQKFSFVPPGMCLILDSSANERNGLVDLCPLGGDQSKVDDQGFSKERHIADKAVVPSVRSVSMRDMGTEMTPATSQEPSRTSTPVGATTPLRSPTSSIPSTPRLGAPASTPLELGTDDESDKRRKEGNQNALSERDMQLKTRREIVALGVQLGKMNIAAWASKDEKENNASSIETDQTIDTEKLDRIEFEKRATAWEDAEKSRHAARYKREEIKIQAWESQRKGKLEADLRRIEAQVEQMRAQAQEKKMKRIAITRQRSEEKRAAAEAKRNREAEKTAARAEYIRQTGRFPSSNFICCSWLS